MAALAALDAHAGGDSAAEVERAARRLLQEQITRAGLRDARLTLEVVAPRPPAPPCPATPEISALDTRQVSRMRFVAQCVAENRSETFIVRASVSAPVLVASGAIRAGDEISETMLKLESRSLPNVGEAVAAPEEVIGQSSRRSLRAGQPIERRMLAAALLVRKGETVQIVANREGINASVTGQAMEAGHRDEIISVRNVSSGRLIRARVSGAGEVEALGSTR